MKGGKGAASSSASRVLSQALDAKQSTMSLDPKVKTKIKLKFSKAARKRIRAALAKGGSRKVVVTATATDRFGKTSNRQGQIQADRLDGAGIASVRARVR